MKLGFACAVLLVVSGADFPRDEFTIVYRNGTREKVEHASVKQNTVIVKKDGRSQALRSNQVLAIIDPKGVEQVVEVVLVDAPLTGVQQAQLKRLDAAKPEEAVGILTELANAPSRALVEDLKKLAASQRPETRKHAANGLVMIGAPDTIRAGGAVALGDKAPDVRRAVASALMTMSAVIRRAEWRGELNKGLKDADKDARVAFALLLVDSAGDEAAKVLVTDGVRHADHHIRESAAEALATHGNDGGLTVLIEMLVRKENPYLKANPQADPSTKQLLEKTFVEEKIRVCGLMGELKNPAALKPLRDAARSASPDLASAAKAAADRIQSAPAPDSR